MAFPGFSVNSIPHLGSWHFSSIVKPKNKETFTPPLVGFLPGCFFKVSNLAGAECLINSKHYYKYCQGVLHGSDGNTVPFQECSGHAVTGREGSRKSAVVNITATTGRTSRFEDYLCRAVRLSNR